LFPLENHFHKNLCAGGVFWCGPPPFFPLQGGDPPLLGGAFFFGLREEKHLSQKRRVGVLYTMGAGRVINPQECEWFSRGPTRESCVARGTYYSRGREFFYGGGLFLKHPPCVRFSCGRGMRKTPPPGW